MQHELISLLCRLIVVSLHSSFWTQEEAKAKAEAEAAQKKADEEKAEKEKTQKEKEKREKQKKKIAEHKEMLEKKIEAGDFEEPEPEPTTGPVRPPPRLHLRMP